MNNLYRVTVSFDVMVAAPSPLAAREATLEEVVDEARHTLGEALTVHTPLRVTGGRLALPKGWDWDDCPLGSNDPLSNWAA